MSVDLAASASVSWRPTTTGTVTLAVTTPAGASLTPSTTEASGTYSATVTTDQPGQYLLRWTRSTGTGSPETFADVLNVWPANPRFLLSLEETKRAVGASGVDAPRDALLRLISAASTVVIEDIAGTVLTKDIRQVTDGGRAAIVLWQHVTEDTEITVTVSGRTLTAAEFTVNRRAGVVYATNGWFADGRQNVVIEYVSGASVLPPQIEQAATELIRHQYQVGHGTHHAEWAEAPSGDDTLDTTPSGFLVPRRVLQLARVESKKLPTF